MRLFNSSLFSLPLGEHGITLDEDGQWVKSLELILDGFKGERFEVPGLSIDISHIEPPALQALADRAALRDQKERLEKNSSSSRRSRRWPLTAPRVKPRPKRCTSKCWTRKRPWKISAVRKP